MDEMSADDFRKIKHPKKAKKKRKGPLYADLQTQYERRKGPPVCPPDCDVGSRLYHALVEATQRLNEHRESHGR